MKHKITAFIDGLITYDYILFGGVLALFLLLMVLAILLRKKVGLSIFIILLSFGVLFAGPTVGYVKLHEFIFKNEVTLLSQKQLSFTPAIVIKGTIINSSKKNFKNCKISANVHKVSKNKLKNYLYSFKNIKKMSILEFDIKKGETRSFKMIVEPFTYKRDYNISLKASCE